LIISVKKKKMGREARARRHFTMQFEQHQQAVSKPIQRARPVAFDSMERLAFLDA
jgi:hypothetical protein